MKKTLFLFTAAVAVLAGCKKEVEPLSIKGWEKYQDQYTILSFTHPQGWYMEQGGGNTAYYSSQAEANNFIDLAEGGKSGAKLSVATQKNDSLITLEEFINSRKLYLSNAGFEVTSTASGTLDGEPALIIRYQGFVTNKDKMGVAEATALRDSVIYTVKFEAFNTAFEQTAQAFDSAMASLILPARRVVQANVDPSVPLEEFKVYDNNCARLSIPANFDGSLIQPKAPTEFAFEIKGYRQDCYIRIDVMPAQKLSTEKIVEQNSKYYKASSRGETTIDGVKTPYMNYSPKMKDIQSRVYFLVKNDKFYRIIINYYIPMKEAILPAFEKSLASLHVK